MSEDREGTMSMSERGSMRGMNGRERRRAPAGRARMACAALLSCALAACGGGDGGGSPTGPAPPPAQAALTVTAGDAGSGSVSVAVGFGADGVVGAGASSSVTAAGDTVTLTADPADGWTFAGWTLSPQGLACAGGLAANPCVLAAGSVTAGATVEAAFVALSALTVTAGANGSVAAEVAGAAAVTVAADSSRGFTVSVLSTATLTATAAGGYVFAGWTLSGGLSACAAGLAANPCELPVGSLTADATAEAAFVVLSTLTVVAGANGSVAAEVAGAAAVTVAADSSRGFTVSVLSTATLTATAAGGYAFADWTLSGGLSACAAGLATSPCALATGSLTADATAEAAFEAVQTTLTVAAGANGRVAAVVGDAAAPPVAAGSSQSFSFSVLSSATLTATAADGYTFAGWTLSGPPGLACGGMQAHICELPAGSVTADATVEAAFARPVAPWRGPGSVSVSPDGSTHTAVPYAPGAFENWAGAPCDGSAQPECDVSSVADSADLPVAVFRPFAVGGIKSLAFGLGYHGADPDHFRVSFRDGMSSGFTPVPSLERLAPDSGPARLAVSVHLLPWELRAYLTEGCNASNSCEAADDERTLEQADSVAATGYFKAPNAASDEQFGWGLALSGDGATLAVGVPQDDSASSGAFAPTDGGYQTALSSNVDSNSGAVTVYRRSGSTWRVEAFVKAPEAEAGSGDNFGTALALSADGATLAVGAPYEDSASTGTFAPTEDGYQAALDSDGTRNSGAAYVYRRSSTGQWSVEAFVKAPVAGRFDELGHSLALSADGATLAVGAPDEDSASTGTFAPTDEGYQAALDSGGANESGAAYVYRRSDVDSRWTIEAFVKAPEAGANDGFGDPSEEGGKPLALSADGATLAVGARSEDSASTGTFAPGEAGYQAALNNSGSANSGAVTVYRRSDSTWRVEAFIKAPEVGANDQFGRALALDGSGATLAVGARWEDSASTGTFVPGGEGYQTALDSDGAENSGAVTVYRRYRNQGDDGWVWEVEAFVKAPNAAAGDEFGLSLDLSSGGVVMAVGSSAEDSSFSGAFAPTDPGYQAALDEDMVYDHDGNSGTDEIGIDAGAAYIYRHPTGPGAWTVGNFVKAPKTDVDDSFGSALALSGDGATLAVGAINEDGGPLSQPAGGRSADTGNAMGESGAVYLY